MFNLLKMKTDHEECKRLRDVLEGVAAAPFSAAQREHLAACADCREAADAISVSRSLLRELPSRAAEPGPWFAPRVMAAIAAREVELRQTLDAWAAVPRLAARLTWVSALALLLASTWLYQSPKHAQNSGNQNPGTVESLFDATQSPAPDDVLLPVENVQ
jgi:predicted anti-sigma-YlaC factor YlaD